MTLIWLLIGGASIFFLIIAPIISNRKFNTWLNENNFPTNEKYMNVAFDVNNQRVALQLASSLATYKFNYSHISLESKDVKVVSTFQKHQDNRTIYGITIDTHDFHNPRITLSYGNEQLRDLIYAKMSVLFGLTPI